jgi:hypothetical protein
MIETSAGVPMFDRLGIVVVAYLGSRASYLVAGHASLVSGSDSWHDLSAMLEEKRLYVGWLHENENNDGSDRLMMCWHC